MVINKLTLHNFGIFEDYETKIKPTINIFAGKNAIGKTTLLNAISWCLTGCGVDNQTITYDSFVNKHHKHDDMFVEIEFNNKAKIKRKIDGSHKQTLYVNGEETPIKVGEVKIENEMNLLKDLNVSKDMKKILLNPLYISELKTTEFTQLIIELLPKQKLKPIDDPRVKTLLETNNDNIETVDKHLKKEVKLAKDKISQLKYLLNYLQNDFKSNLPQKELEKVLKQNIEFVESEIAKTTKDLIAVELSKDNFDKYITYKNRVYQTLTKNELGVEFVFAEQTIEEGWKNVCIPLTENGIPYKMASTSEKIIVGYKIIEAIKRIKGYGNLPVLIDKAESIDKYKLNSLNLKSQIIATQVNSAYENLKVKGN